jgi:hypothetical protein
MFRWPLIRGCSTRPTNIDVQSHTVNGMNGPVVGQHGSGQLELLQWVRARGCPWDHHTCCVLVPDKWDVWRYCNGFRDLGCPWTARTCERRQIWAFRSIEVGHVTGIRKNMRLQRSMDIGRSSNGFGNKIVRGIPILVPMRPSLDI